MRFSAFILVSILSIVSCTKTDRDAPTFDRFALDGAEDPVVDTLLAWTATELVVEISDNEEVGAVRIEIHPNSTAYSHSKHTSYGNGFTGEWYDIDVTEYREDKASVTRGIAIPNDVEGEFHLVVDAIDPSGNKSETKSVVWIIENPHLPKLFIGGTIPEANEAGELIISAVDMLQIEGVATDDVGILQMRYTLVDDQETEIWTQEFDAGGAISYPLGNDFLSFENVVSGAYSLIIKVVDTDGLSRSEALAVTVAD